MLPLSSKNTVLVAAAAGTLVLASAAVAGTVDQPKNRNTMIALNSAGKNAPTNKKVVTDKNKFAVPVSPISAKQEKLNADTARAINKVPGVHLEAKDLQPPAPDPPIKGFHPIKRALQPVVQLEKNSVQLQQQIMKLEGPIGALQPAMNGLHKKMDAVDQRMGVVDGRLGEMDGHIVTMDTHVREVGNQMSGVRSDLTKMRSDLNDLQSPLHSLLKPLNNVAKPLEEVRTELADMRAMLAGVLFAIVASTIGIAIGTPIMAILIYKYRRKLFPNSSDRDFPVVADSHRPVAHHPLEE